MYVYMYTYICVYIIECYSTMKRRKLPFATTWMKLEGIIVSEMSEKNEYFMMSLVCGS